MSDYRMQVSLPPGMPTPHLEHVLAVMVPNIMRAAWRDVALDHVSTGSYIAAIMRDDAIQYPYQGNKDLVSVVNTSPHAIFLEHGRQGFHLPSRWTNWQIGKNGNRYARIPMRHYSPTRLGGGASTHRIRQQMPEEIYAMAKRLRAGQRLTGLGNAYRVSRPYKVYRVSGEKVPRELGRGYTWKVSKYEGLFRTHMPTPGGGRHTWYMTIRTITPQSKGWFIPSMPALKLSEKAMQRAKPAIDDVLHAAIEADVETGLARAMDSAMEDFPF